MTTAWLRAQAKQRHSHSREKENEQERQHQHLMHQVQQVVVDHVVLQELQACLRHEHAVTNARLQCTVPHKLVEIYQRRQQEAALSSTRQDEKEELITFSSGNLAPSALGTNRSIAVAP